MTWVSARNARPGATSERELGLVLDGRDDAAQGVGDDAARGVGDAIVGGRLASGIRAT